MAETIVGLVILLAVILVSMMLHELAHGYVAYWLGDDTAKENGRLTLNPLKHLDPFMSVLLSVILFIAGGPIFGGAKPVPINTRNLKFNEWGFALVALAGPMMNFVLAFIGFLISYFAGWWVDNGTMGLIAQEFVMVNLGFGIFNLIPIPPLDGSRILYAISPDGVRVFLREMERWGIFVVLILVVVFGNVFSTLLINAMNGILNGFYFIVGA
ncbi:site-2 protease family protein [Candidatus Saccharibacteria bacterium]|nr:site-2 protease family protein [Candidatus Saccharibacteria bacterium]